mmetsp:Transcript_58711/g.182377  ORF Transcript_58711/g.182377 Transcript_58711/m.182377 type:complete len:112 (-) Transcript_58711:1363-1698(-)
MTTTRSARSTVLTRCAMTMEVRPAMMRSRASSSWCSVSESRALVASSSSSRGGFTRSIRAMATRCFWPPERFWPNLPTSVSRPRGSSAMKDQTLAAVAAATISSGAASSLP